MGWLIDIFDNADVLGPPEALSQDKEIYNAHARTRDLHLSKSALQWPRCLIEY